MNFREYIVDLMADPGTLIPSDAAGSSHTEYEESFSTSPFPRDIDSSQVASSSGGVTTSFQEHSEFEIVPKRPWSKNFDAAIRESDERAEQMPSADLLVNIKAEEGSKESSGSNPRSSNMHARSPSWTEGVSSPAAHKMKVKDVSRYMIDAAKENPQLAQKLHDVLLESGVVAPPNLFTEIYKEQSNIETAEAKSMTEYTQKTKGHQADLSQARFLPPLPYRGLHSKVSPHGQPEYHQDLEEVNVRNVPVAAAAAAAAVVASSMVVAVTRTTNTSGLELPVAAAATATAAALVATSAAVGKQYENLETYAHSPSGSGNPEHHALGGNHDGERVSDRSTGNESTKSDVTLDDVADCEIPWEDITLGERIGLGTNLKSYSMNYIFSQTDVFN